MSAEPDTCYRWSRDLVVAHAVFTSGFITAPVAVLLLLHRPRSGRAIFFAAFAAFCTTVSLILCCRFYAELRRPPWPRWLSAASGVQQRQQQVEEDGSAADAAGQETEVSSHSHALRHPEQQAVMMVPCVEMEVKAALARIPCYGYERPTDDDGGAAEDCAVCLGEVDEGELVRRLPACRHVFHRDCIDLWLRAHDTCPVCRSGVLSPAAAEVVVDVGAVHGWPMAAGLAPPDISFSGRPGPRFCYGPSVPISRLG